MNNQQTKTVVIVGSAYPLRGGLSNYNERLAREYLKNNYSVIIYTFSLQYPNFLFPGKSQYSDEPAPIDLDIRIRINSVNPFTWIAVGREIKKLRPDIAIIKFWIPFMSPCLGTIARIIKKNKHTKIISIIDNIIPHEKRLGDRILANYFVKSVHGFIAMSKSVLTDLDTFDKKRGKLFNPHPVYDNFGKPVSKLEAKRNLGLNSDTNYILFFGFIRDYKGLDLLLHAFAYSRFRNMNLKLIVAGEFYTNSKPYFKIIEANKLQDYVIMSNDFIPDSKVADYFCACDMVVQPYKSATQSGVTQIAYHFEVPMLVTDVGGLSEIVPHKKVGYVVKVDKNEIAEAILDFYNQDREAEFIPNIILEKKKYSWEQLISNINNLVKES